MRALLVAMDGSKSGLRALDYAISHAKGRQTEIHLLNVQPLLDDYDMVSAYISNQKHRQLATARAQTILAPAVSRLKRSRVRHQVHVGYGEPWELIARASRRLKCDSIVMGTRGMGLAGNLLLGSVATKVVHLAKVPVTLVR